MSLNKKFSVSFKENITVPNAEYVYISRQNHYLRFNIPQKDFLLFEKTILPFFNTVFSKLPKNLEKGTFPKFYFNALLHTSFNHSPVFLNKLRKSIRSLSSSQMELFLENNAYNVLNVKKANPLFDVLRIKNGVLTKKVLSVSNQKRVVETYGGFIRALKEGTSKIVRLNIEGKDKLLLVKSFPGKKRNVDFIPEYGVTTLALDPTTLEIFTFKRKHGSINNSFEPLNLVVNKSSNPYLVAKRHLETHKPGLDSNTPIKDAFSLNIISEANKIKALLKKYTAENQAKNIASFKKDAFKS